MAQEPSSEVYSQTMFVCMPLRLGVLLSAAFTFFTSMLYVLDRPFWEYVFRHITCGYALASRVTVGAVEVTGVPFGLLGLLGTWYSRPSYVLYFNFWQLVRLGAYGYVYYVDVPLLMHCEDWVNAVEAVTKAHGWNALMYQIAIAGNCGTERSHFLALSFVSVVVFAYIILATSRYQEFMARVPKHLLRVPKDLASGIFYAHSTGERSYLNGDYGTYDHHPSKPDPHPMEGAPFTSQPFGFPGAGPLPP